jgi:lipopolysaccharide transport system ATP-binding protein
MESIISVENLGKKYMIDHRKQDRYKTLRDTLSHGARSLYQRLRHPFSPNSEEIETEAFWALKDINFEVKQGDRLGIIGRNGAGKSTLLKILSRITHLTTGRVHIKSRIASLLEVGTGFHPELTGRENIFLNGAILGMSRSDIINRFDEIVAFAEVENFLDTPVKRYSSGMYVRLAFAVAAHLEPEILIVDEVLAVGDTQFQKKCLGKMNDASKREGHTVLFVSHNMAAISALCNKVLVLDAGNLIMEAPTQIAVEEYLKGGKNSQQSIVEWTIDNAPGDDVVNLIKVATLNEDNQIPEGFDRSESIYVQLEYIVQVKRSLPIVAQIRVFNQLGTCIFISITPYKQEKEYDRCRCRSTCIIPPNLMNEGIYFLDVYLNTPLREMHLHQESVVSFKVTDSAMRKYYFGPIPGAVRPDLLWNIEQIN